MLAIFLEFWPLTGVDDIFQCQGVEIEHLADVFDVRDRSVSLKVDPGSIGAFEVGLAFLHRRQFYF